MAAQLSQFALLDCFQVVLQQIEQPLKQIEQLQIQSEEAKFRSLFEQSADALMLAENGVIFDCNQATVELFGWQDRAILPLHAAQLSPEYQPDGRASFEKASQMVALAQQNGNHRFEWMHRRHNGEDFWTEILLTQIEFDGKLIQYTTIRDISDRKQIEDKLREGERRFQAIFNQTFQLAGILSPDGILLEANQTALDVIAAQPEEVIGQPFWETPWWAHSAELQQQLQQAIAQVKAGQAVSFEYDSPTADGKMLTLRFSIKPITNSQGEVVMLISEARDISDRKEAEAERLQAEAALREQEQFLRIIYDNVEVPILVIDVLPDGNLHYASWNSTTEQYIGQSREEIAGKTPEEVFGQIEGAADRSRLTQCVQEKKAITIEEHFTLKGESTWWITSHSPLFDQDGCVYRIVSTSFNISDRKEAEAERLQAEAALREQEQFLRIIYDNVEIPIIVIDVLPDGNFHYVSWNSTAERFSGWSREEIIGKTPEEIFGELEGAADRSRLMQCVQENQVLMFEECLTLKGESTWWITSHNPLCDQEGRVHRIVSTSFNITDRKRTEEALQQSETRFQELANNLPGMIYQFRQGADGFQGFTYVSPGCLDLHEVSAEAFMQDNKIGLAMIHPEDKPQFIRSIALSAQTLQGWQQEYRIITPSGELKWLQGHSQPKRLVNGDIVWDGFLTDVSDRKQAEAALEYQSNLLRTVIDSSPDWIFVKDCNFRYLLANRAVADAAGVSPEEMIGKDDLEVGLSPEEVFGNPEKGIVGFRANDQSAIAGKIVFHAGEPVTSTDGSFTWVETQKLPLRDRQGRIFGLLGVCRDITERKRAEVALRQSEQNLRTIFNSVLNSFFIHDLDGTILDVNQKVLEMYGVTREQALQMSIPDYGSADNPIEQLPEILGKAIAGEVQQIEWKGKRQDGTLFDAEVTIQRLMLSDRPVIFASVQDVSDRKQAEFAVQQSREMLQLVIDTLPQIIGWKDRNSIFMGCNKKIAKIAGFNSPEDMIGKSDYEMPWTPEETAGYLECDRRIMESGVAEMHIIEQQTQTDGTVVWLDTNKIPLRDADGNVIGILFAIEDITDRKRLEDERAQAEVALRYSEQRFRDVTEAAGEYIWELDAAGCYSFVSDRVKTVKGYEPAELIGRSPFECLAAEDVERTQAILQDAVSNRSSFKLECRSIVPSGEIIWEEVSGIPLVNHEGEIVGFRGTALGITDRKQAEAELRKTQRQFQMLMDYAPAVIYIKDLEGKYLAVSRNFCEIFDLRLEDIIDQDDYQVHPPAIAEIIRSNDRAVIASKSGLTIEETVMQTTGEHSYISTKFTFKDEQGNPYALCGISFDISDLKQAEKALRQQQIQLQTILDAVPSSIWLKDAQNNVLRANAAAAAVSGLSADQIEGKSTFELFPEEAEAYYQDDLEVMDSGQPKLGIIEPQHMPSGEQRWMRTDKVPFRNSAGEIVGLVAVATDITDRKRTEIALRESEQQLREQAQRERLLNRLTQQIRNSLDFDIALSTALTEIQSLLEVDRCQFVCYYPNEEEPYWEITKEVHRPDQPELIGRYPASTTGAFPEQVLQLQIMKMNDAEAVDDLVWKQFTRSVAIRSMLAIPIQMPSGTIGTFCCSTRCVHDWKPDEIELLEAVVGQLAIALNQADLYAQSRAKAHELEQTLHQLQRTQAQMLQSEKMSSLGQLVAGVAHEINNPVNFIYGNLNYASDYIKDLLGLVKLYQQQYPQPVDAIETQAEAIDLDFLIADLPKLLNSMKVGANRIQKIVASLRTFSRMDEAEVKSVNIHEGIDSTLLILQHRLKKRDDRSVIEIVKQYDNLPPIECYAGQLNQVFMNLLSNAIDALEDAMEDNTDLVPTITIQTKLLDQFVSIEIIDNGIGVPKAVQQRLFDPFFTTKPLGKGTGMGLSISYQIVVEKHNGSIDCLSSEAGTTFIVKIPVEQGS